MRAMLGQDASNGWPGQDTRQIKHAYAAQWSPSVADGLGGRLANFVNLHASQGAQRLSLWGGEPLLGAANDRAAHARIRQCILQGDAIPLLDGGTDLLAIRSTVKNLEGSR